MEKVKTHLENLRGTLGDADDLYIECSSGYPGLNGAYGITLLQGVIYIRQHTVRPST